MAPTPENAPCWHQIGRPGKIYFKHQLKSCTIKYKLPHNMPLNKQLLKHVHFHKPIVRLVDSVEHQDKVFNNLSD